MFFYFIVDFTVRHCSFRAWSRCYSFLYVINASTPCNCREGHLHYMPPDFSFLCDFGLCVVLFPAGLLMPSSQSLVTTKERSLQFLASPRQPKSSSFSVTTKKTSCTTKSPKTRGQGDHPYYCATSPSLLSFGHEKYCPPTIQVESTIYHILLV